MCVLSIKVPIRKSLETYLRILVYGTKLYIKVTRKVFFFFIDEENLISKIQHNTFNGNCNYLYTLTN